MSGDIGSRLRNLTSYLIAVVLAALILGMAVLTAQMILNGV